MAQSCVTPGLLHYEPSLFEIGAPGRSGASLPELDVPEVTTEALVPEDIPLDVVYRDDDVIVIDKPAGLVTHPSPGHERGTLVNALLALEAGEGGLGTDSGGVVRPNTGTCP